MEKKQDKVIKVMGTILLVVTIVIFNFIIGANEKGLRILPISILMTLNIIYFIILKIKNKNQSIFFKSKVDYFVLAFMLTTTLPLIFRTCVSYSDTVEFIMKYFFTYSVYILARNVLKDKKSIEIIITVTLVSSLVPIVLGFDYDNTKILKEFTKWLNVDYTAEKAFHGTFGYANTQAIYSALCIFLAMHKFKIHKNKFLKVIDVIYILFSLYIIWIAESRAVLLLVGIALIALLIAKFRKQIAKHKKKIIIGVGIIVFIAETFLIIALNTSKPIIKYNEDIDKKIIYNFKQGETYTLELNMTTEPTQNTDSNKTIAFEIELIQNGPYFKNSSLALASSDVVKGYYKIDFTPTQDTKVINVKIRNRFGGTIKIDDFFINGKKQMVEYKYIPNNIGYLLSRLYIEGKSLPQREYMYKDCLKMAADSPIFGNGGDTWKIVSRAVEDYKVAMKECHSYFFELLISYGIVGVCAFLILVIYFFVKIFKQCKKDENKRKEKLLIAVGLLLVLLHTIIDFDMSFMLIQLLVYIYMAVLLYDEQNLNNEVPKKHRNIKDYVLLVLLIYILGLYIRTDISEYLIQDKKGKYAVSQYRKTYYYEKLKLDISENTDIRKKLDGIKSFMEKEKYNYSSTNNYKTYFQIIIENTEVLSTEKLNYYIDWGLNSLKTIRFRTPMYYDTVIQRAQMIADIINDFNNYKSNEEEKTKIIEETVEELKQIFKKEYDINIKNIQDYEKTGMSQMSRNTMVEKYKNILNNIK